MALPPDGPDLDALQGASFTLATLSLEGIAPGVTNLDLVDAQCGDAEDPPQQLPLTVQGASLTTVPEPSLFGGILAGVLLLAELRRRRP